jgi:hypothetical protein
MKDHSFGQAYPALAKNIAGACLRHIAALPAFFSFHVRTSYSAYGLGAASRTRMPLIRS